MKSYMAATPSSSRYSLRDRQKSTPQLVASVSTAARPRPRTRTADPVAFMLKEKRAAQRRGYDPDALIDENPGLSSPFAADSEGDADDEMADEPRRAFGTATPASDLPPSRLQTPDRTSELDEGLQMLGSERKAVGMMLDEDLASRRRTRDHTRTGVVFWEESHSFGESDDYIPSNALPQLVLELPKLGVAASTFADAVNKGGALRVRSYTTGADCIRSKQESPHLSGDGLAFADVRSRVERHSAVVR